LKEKNAAPLMPLQKKTSYFCFMLWKIILFYYRYTWERIGNKIRNIADISGNVEIYRIRHFDW